METMNANNQQTFQQVDPKASQSAPNKKRKPDEGEFALPADFYNQLNVVTVDVIKPLNNQIFVCYRNDKLIDVWKGLIRHKFHSAPVMLSNNTNKYFGMIDLHDICKYVIDCFGKEGLDKITAKDFWKDLESSEKLKTATVRDVMKYPMTRENPFHPVGLGYSLHFALELLAKEPNLERVPVITRDRKLMNMLTQSRLVQFFRENRMSLLGNRMSKPVSLLNNSNTGVVSVTETQMALDAFTLMQKHSIPAIPVTATDGKLIGIISETDLKVIHEDGSLFYKLYQSTKIFVDSLPQKDDLVTVKVGNTFADVIDRLCDRKVHQVFVVNDQNVPIGKVSFKDIIVDLLTH